MASYAPSIRLLSTLSQYKAYIIATLAILLIYLIYSKLTVPKHLRHIPHVPFWKIIASILRGEPLDVLQRNLYLPAYAESGLLMRMSLGTLVVGVAHPEYARILLNRLDLFPKMTIFQSDGSLRASNRLFGGSNVMFENGAHWKRHRMIANPAFHRAMPVQLFGRLTQKLIEKFTTENYHVKVDDYLRRFTLDVTGLSAFGFDFNSLDEEKSRWAELYRTAIEGVANPLYLLFPILENNFLWALPARRELHNKISELDDLLLGIIENKKRVISQKDYKMTVEDDTEMDLLTMMLEANRTEKHGGLNNKELRDNLVVFFIAAHDTTASALTSAIYFLAMNKECQRKARAEAIAVLGDAPEDVSPTVEETLQLRYISQVMKETMRLNPPATVTLPRVATADVSFGPYLIPKGAHVSLDMYAMHHSSRNWADPERFDPERFAEGGESDAKGNDANFAWVPFSGGGRQCLGINFSLTEQRVVLSMLLRKFEWDLPADSIHRDYIKLNPKLMNALVPMDVFVDFRPRY